MRVVLAEDDPAIAEPLARALRREGYDVAVSPDGAGTLVLVREGADLVVLDLGLPDIDGVEVCRRLRAGGMTMPVLVLTARADEIDLVVGLDAGADDYVTKPFRLAELLARVRALLRRGERIASVGEALSVRGVTLDPASRRAWVADGAQEPPGAELALAVKEFDLLHVLMREAGAVVPREHLMHSVWGVERLKSTKTLDMHVSWLRRKLGDDSSSPRWITTVRGVGFRFERD